MKAFLIYIIQVNLLLVLVWLVHKLLLSKHTFHQFKRWYFLSGIMLSIIVPLLSWEDVTVIPITINNAVSEEKIVANAPQEVDFWMMGYAFALLVLVVYSIRASVQLWKAVKSLRRITHGAVKVDGWDNVYMSERVEVPFSTSRKIYIHPNLLQSTNLNQIILHEEKHIADQHCVDIWMFQIFNVFFSYNPIVKRLLHDVKLNHEFIVDDFMMQSVDPVGYQLQLVQFQHNNFQIDLANQFAFSNLKQRIFFMNTKQSSKWKWSSMLLATMILGATSFAIAYEKVTMYEIATPQENKDTTKQPLMLLNGKKYDGDINTIDPQTIAAVNVYKNEEAIKKYGKEGENGVVDVTLKSDNIPADTSLDIKVKVKIEKASTDLNEKTQGTVEFTSKNNPAELEQNIKEVGAYVDALINDESKVKEVDTVTSIPGQSQSFRIKILDIDVEQKVLNDFVLKELDNPTSKNQKALSNATFFVDGKELKDISSIDTKSIKSLNVLKGVQAVLKYGKGYEKGVIEITLKK